MNINTKKRLAFSLLAKDNGSDDTMMWNVHPSYSDAKLNWSKESNEWYHTLTIDGTFTFNGSEAEIITGRSLYTEFTLVIFDLDNGGNEVSRGTFRLTDCEIDIDHRSVKVKITATDPYKKLNDRKDNEYNVVDLGLDRRSLNIWSYPIYQTYVLGDNQVLVSTRNWTAAYECESMTDVSVSALGYNARFGKESYIGYAQFDNPNPGGIISNMFGFYSPTYEVFIEGIDPICCRMVNEHNYKIEISSNAGSDNFSAILYDGSDNIVAYSYNPNTEDHTYNKGSFMSHQEILFRISQGVYLGSITIHLWGIVRRCLTNIPGTPLDSADFYPCNFTGGFSKEYLPPTMQIVMTTNISDTDQGYGRVPNTDTWYDKPDHTNNWIPLYRDSWYQGKSFWMRGDVKVTWMDINNFKTKINIIDFYSLGDVIKGVLAKIDENIIFEPDSDHSRFLFDTINPITEQQQGELLVSQKSNILKLQYDYPAWKAPVKMSQILTFLRNAFNCYYHIDEDNHFHIEHVLYYMNGGSYDTEQRGVVDLTRWRDCANKQKLSFLTNRWTYEKDTGKQANRIEFGWMDNQSELFNGWPIIVPEDYLIYTDERTEERKVDWFSTDIEFLTSVPAECSSDGFVVARKSLIDNTFVEEGDFQFNGTQYITQNVSLSFPELHRNFMLFDLWSEYVTINNDDTLIAVRKRAPVRTAEVGFIKPATMDVNDPNVIIKTDAGNGEVESMEINLSDMRITTKLKYEI